MVRLTLLLLAGTIMTFLPLMSEAGEVFLGVTIDNKSQYFSYLGVRVPLQRISGELGLSTSTPPPPTRYPIPTLQASEEISLFVHVLTAGLGYHTKSNGQILDANAQFIVPSLGIAKTLNDWTFSALVGPQLRRIEEQQPNASKSIDYQAGVYGQLEAFYRHEKWNFLAIGSYADLDNFFWSRLRGKALVYKPEKSCCATYVGWDATGMGSADFRGIMTGPVGEVQVGNVFLLVRGGYQNNTAFHGGAYGGFEVYSPF